MIAPLQKRSDGKTYSRPAEVDAALALLDALPIEEVARRAEISDDQDPEYVPSECVLHFVRRSKANGDGKAYQDLFKALWNRLRRAAPVRLRRVSGLANAAESDVEQQIQEKVLFDFQQLLCQDREYYDERLDYYEVRFNSAVATLRATARRAILSKQSRRKPLQYDGDSSDLTLEMEQALERVRRPDGENEEDADYRLRFYEAISNLPDDQRRVMELLLNGMQLEAIAKILGCVEKTVRNRRDRAFATIRLTMQEE